MKKLLLILMLLISLHSFSQDTTGREKARWDWQTNPNNFGKPVPTWDDNGNIVTFAGILTILFIAYYKKQIVFKRNLVV
jgi:hypothetical protein